MEKCNFSVYEGAMPAVQRSYDRLLREEAGENRGSRKSALNFLTAILAHTRESYNHVRAKTNSASSFACTFLSCHPVTALLHTNLPHQPDKRET